MANPQKGEVALNLPDGRTLTLVMNTNAMAAIEEATGGSWDEFFKRALNPAKARISDLRMMVYGMTREYHPEITLQEAGRLIDAIGGTSQMAERIAVPLVSAVTPDPEDLKALGVSERPTSASPNRKHRKRGGAASIYRPVRSA